MKSCTKCKINKSLNDFNTDKLRKDGYYPQCKQCVKIYKASHYQQNKIKLDAINKKWKVDNRERWLSFKKQWYSLNCKKWIEWYNNNKTHKMQYQLKYRMTDVGKANRKANHQKRRALKNNSTGKYTGAEILKLLVTQKSKCVYCKSKLIVNSANSYHIDHINPLNKGGTNAISNIQLLCPKCNLQKHDKDPEIFAQRFGMLI